MPEVIETPLVRAQVARLRARQLDAYTAWRRDLALDGCAAMGYRFPGSPDLTALCVRHLTGRWRVVVAFRGDPPNDEAHVVLVGEHDDRSPTSTYALLYGALVDLLSRRIRTTTRR